MTTDLIDVLDTALHRLNGGEPISAILADYPSQAEALASLLPTVTTLKAIQAVEMPAPEAWQADRAAFLAKVTALQQSPVSHQPLDRLKAWIVHIFPWYAPNLTYQRKEQKPMIALLIKATLIFGIVFGSAGGTAAMAANSLPTSPLYPLKLTMEQGQLALTSDPVTQANLHLTLAQVRAQEMQQTALASNVPDEASLNRLQQHLNQAFQLAAQLPDEDMLPLLTRAQSMLQTQEQLLAQAQAQVGQPAQEILGQANRLLNQARQQVEAGLQDPQAFRRQHTPGSNPNPTVTPCPTGDCEPVGDQNQNQNQHQNQNQNGSPSGEPGTCPTGDCEPVGDQNQNQNGSPSGEPGTCPTGDCEPVGDQNQNQNGASSGEPGDCPTGDCKPVGDQNQNGSQSGESGAPCNTGECEPVGDEHHYGQETEQPAGPYSNPDCTGDCEPVGDQNQNQNQNGPQQPAPAPVPQPAPSNPQPTAAPTDGGSNDNGNNDSDNGSGSSDNSGGSDNGGSQSDGGSSDGGDNGSGGGKK